ncbi:helix-turn-helix domain-containing protein [Labrenzia sp. R4_2]|nr:helix-turn-helix domain-containing protein [Labrenzia sp. R4_2]
MSKFELNKINGNIGHWDVDVQPLELCQLEGKIATVCQVQDSGYMLTHVAFILNSSHKGKTPCSFYTFSIPMNDGRVFWHNGRSVLPGQVIVQKPGSEFNVITPAGFEVLHISVPSQELERCLGAIGLDKLGIERLPDILSLPEEQLEAVWEEYTKLATARTSLQVRDKSEKFHQLISAWVARYGLKEKTTNPTAAKKVFRACLEAVTRDEYQDLTVRGLCDRYQLSRRSLEVEFREALGVGPAAFLKTIRLTNARRKLTSNTTGRTQIAAIMHSVGFSHVGQFARDYRKMFGELPSKTLLQAQTMRKRDKFITG